MFPTLHYTEPAEDFLGSFFVLEAHDRLLLTVRVHERPDAPDLLAEGFLDLAFNVILGGLPGDQELEFALVLEKYHGLFRNEREFQGHLPSLQAGECTLGPDSQTSGLHARRKVLDIQLVDRDGINPGEVPGCCQRLSRRNDQDALALLEPPATEF